MTDHHSVTSAMSMQALFSAISDLSGIPIEIVAQDRSDLTLAHAELGRLIERIPAERMQAAE